MGQGLHGHHEAIPGLSRRRVRLRGASPPRTPRRAGVCHEAIADGVRAPGAGAAASAALLLALIRRDSRYSIRLTRTPPRVDMLHMGSDGCGCLRLGSGRGLDVLLRQLTRMHHNKAHLLLHDAPVTVLHLHRSQPTWPMPAAGLLVLGASGFFYQEGQGGWLLAPCFQLGADRTGAWHQGDQAKPFLQTEAQRPATLGLAVPYNPLNTLKPKTEALFDGARRLHTRARLPIPAPHTQWQPAIATDSQPQEHLLEIRAAISAVSVSWPRGSRCLWLVRIHPIERNRCGVLRQPGGRDGRDRERFEGDSPKDPLEIGGTQHIEDVPEPVIMERGPR
jgi:hypothetical protein